MTRLIQRYYLREFFKLFSIVALGLALISSLMELIDKLEGFMHHGPSIGILMRYTALNVPKYLVYLMPASALISSLFVLGQAGRRKETVAIKAAGGSTKRLLTPFVFTGIFLCIAGFLISEFVAPGFAKRAHGIRNSLAKKENVITVKEGIAWLRAREHIVKIELFLPDKGIVRGISILKIQDDALAERLEAESGEWQPVWESKGSQNEKFLRSLHTPRSGGVWYLRGVTIYDIKTGTVKKFREIHSDIIDSPDILGRGAQKPEEMNLLELFSYTKRLREAGIKNTKLLIDIHARLSFPLINLIMLVVGISLSTGREIKSGFVTTAIGICISLLYWLAYTASLSLGYTGILPPLLAAWTVPAAFGAASVHLFRQIPE